MRPPTVAVLAAYQNVPLGQNYSAPSPNAVRSVFLLPSSGPPPPHFTATGLGLEVGPLGADVGVTNG